MSGEDGSEPRKMPSTARKGAPELRLRIVSAFAMAACAIGVTWLGGGGFQVFWALVAAQILREWLGIVGPSRIDLLVPGVVALAIAMALGHAGSVAYACVALFLGGIVTGVLAARDRRLIAGLGPLYAGALLVPMVLLRRSDGDGFAIIIWLFAVVWGTDTFAYFGGRLIGGPKLAPRFSPSKTWSGFIVGILSGALLGLAVAPRHDCIACLLVAGLFGGALAQAGDLLESALKRRFGVKDSGSLIPGHGGVMDRLDGFIAASVFAVAVGLWRFGPTSAGAGLLRW